MKEKEKKAITKVPTLLELAQMVEKKPAPPSSLAPSSDESDYDQPPVKESYRLGDELHMTLLNPPLSSRRKTPREKNSSMYSQQSSTSEETSTSESSSDEELQDRLLKIPYATGESSKLRGSLEGCGPTRLIHLKRFHLKTIFLAKITDRRINVSTINVRLSPSPCLSVVCGASVKQRSPAS